MITATDALTLCLKILAIVLLVVLEDYVLWRLWRLRLAFTSPFNKLLYPNSPPNASHKPCDTTDNQTVDKAVIVEKLDSRRNQPHYENDNCKPHHYQENQRYQLFIGFGHIPYLLRSYGVILHPKKKGGQPNANRTHQNKS